VGGGCGWVCCGGLGLGVVEGDNKKWGM